MGPDAPNVPAANTVPWYVLAARIAAALVVTLIFLVSVKVLGAGFKMAGKGAVDGLLETASNPLVGLFIGVLVTSVIQSSSTTTSMLVGLVAAGTMPLRTAIPIVMGANIGTTVTNTIVAMGHVTRPREFRRAISCSTMHDFFNMLCVIILLPLEHFTHILERGAGLLTRACAGWTGVKKESMWSLKVLIDPPNRWVKDFCTASFEKPWAAVAMGAIGVVLMFVSLYLLTKVLKSLMLGKVETMMGSYLDKYGPVGIVIGAGATAAVQSSSVTTSFFVPLAAAGVLKRRQIYPMVVGANIGTTVTALLASLAGDSPAGMQLAFTHFLFNCCGLLLFYPIPAMRWPIALADWFGGIASRNRLLALAYVAFAFYGVPLVLIFGRRLF